METTSELRIEQIGRASNMEFCAGLCDLDWEVRARRLSPEFWPWLYFRNPAGDAVAIIAFHGGRPVGRFERIPVRVTVDGKIETADLLEGLTLAPEFRKWSHLRRMLAMAFRDEPVEKPLFSFGFATAAATRLHSSLGQPVLGRVSVFSAALDGVRMWRGRGVPASVSALAGSLSGALIKWKAQPPGGQIEVRETGDFTSDLDELTSALTGPTAIGLRKDPAYLNWRYVQRPGASYRRLIARKDQQPAGMLVWCPEEVSGDGYILELAARNGDPVTLDALLDTAREQMRSAGVGLVTASFPRAAAAAQALLRAGFVSWATRWKNMSLIVTPREHGRRTELSMTDWNYSLGDWLYH